MNTATYVYAVVKSERPPRLAAAPRGMPGGAPPRPLGVPRPRHTWLIVSDVPEDAYSADIINTHLSDLDWVTARALAHEAVVEFCSESFDVVPLKLFTIFRDDARAVRHVGHPETLTRVFRRIAGCAEWSVRVSCAPEAVGAPRAAERSRAKTTESGAAFLQRKKAQRDDTRRATASAARFVDETYRALAATARGAVRKEGDVPGSSLMLDAAFLVARAKQRTFAARVKRLAASAAKGGCDLVLSGPWPPYHFVSGD